MDRFTFGKMTNARLPDPDMMGLFQPWLWLKATTKTYSSQETKAAK
jgi:hypothetical protein